MNLTLISRCAATVAAVAIVATGCGGGSDTETTTSETTTTTTTTTSAEAEPSRSPTAPGDGAPGAAPTIADYIAENGITETQIHRGDPGAPSIDLPFPEGWVDAGPDTPEWAYGAIVYPDGGQYTPSIVAIVSKLSGDVDPQAILDYAPNELTNLPGWEPLSSGRQSELSGFPAFQLGGTWTQDGLTKVVAQKTVVITGGDGLYVLQLNADGLENQIDIIGPATDVIDDQTTITP